MKKHWIVLSLVALVIAGSITAAFFLSRPQGNALYSSVKMQADQVTELGVELESGFTLTTGYRITADEVRGMLEMDPPIDFEVSGKDGKNWKIALAAPMVSNEVYTFQVKNLHGTVVQSFAFQTRSDLLVSGVYPRDGATYVEPDAGIEITFNAAGVDISNFFEIRPEVSGAFETNDFTAIFRPEKPLELDSIYRVKIKAGVTAPNGMELKKDYEFSFEVSDSTYEKWDYTQLRLAGDFAETFLTGDPLTVQMSAGSDLTGLEFHTAVYKYPDLDSYAAELKAHDKFYQERVGSKRNDYRVDSSKLDEVVSFDGELLKKDNYYDYLYAILPEDLTEGYYLVEVSGKNAEGVDQFVQKLIQIRNLSVYTQSVDGSTLIWINDPATGEPLEGRSIRLTDTKTGEKLEGTTQADGAVQIMTNQMEAAYLTVLDGARDSFIEKVGLSEKKPAALNERYYTALYTDREIYQPDDTIRVWGIVQPRKITVGPPKYVYATLSGGWPTDEIYRVRLDVAADGTFEGEVKLTGLRKDWYTLAITDGDEGVYTNKGLEVEHYTKPAYVIDVKPTKEYYYANEPVTLEISANYFDGTPVSGGKLAIAAWELGVGGDDPRGIITLDSQGKATFTGYYDPQNGGRSLPGWEPESVWYDISSADEQDVQVNTNGTVTVLPSNIAAKVESDDPSKITVHTALLDPSKLGSAAGQPRPLSIGADFFDHIAGAPVDLPVIVHIKKTEWVQTPVGTYYDYVNKRNITRYKSERVESVVDNIRTETKGGKVVLEDLPYENGDTVFYSFEVQFAGGIMGDVNEVFNYFGPFGYIPRNQGDSYSFTRNEGYNDGFSVGSRSSFEVGEDITLGLYRNGTPIKNQGRVLYTVVQRKPLRYDMFNVDSIAIPMEEDYLPNVVITGAYFDGRHIFPIEQYSVSYQYDSRTLNVEVSADQEAYRPGDPVTATVKVTDAAGNPVQAAVCVGAVDEAIFALREQELDLAYQLYQPVFSPYVQQKVSYVQYNLEKADAATGGYGGGGGGDGMLRKDFLDTALFKTVHTDEKGEAVVSFDLPDNVTSWRLTAAAVTSDPKAGDSTTQAVATLPFYLTPIVSETYLTGDDLAVSLAGVGTGLKEGESIAYTAVLSDAEGNELARQSASGKAGERTAISFGKQAAGQYLLTISGKAGELSDAVQKPVAVVESGIEVPVIKNMPLSEVAGVQSTRYPVKLMIYDDRMKPYMDALEFLSGQAGDRTELIAASYRAKLAYNALLDPEDQQTVRKDVRLDTLQEELGVKPLAAAGPDAALTAKMLVACPDLVNKAAAQEYFEQILKAPASTPDDRVMSYVGLAALGRPVLLELTRMLEEEAGLTDAQRLWLGVGLAEMGDFTGAQKIYEALGDRLVTEGHLKYIKTGGSLDDELAANAAALALTSVTANQDADALLRYFLERENDRARSEKVLYQLEMLTYVENFSLPQGKDKARFSFQQGGALTEIELGEQGRKPMSLSYEALQKAGFKVLSGNLYASVSYVEPASLAQVQENGLVTIEKTYTPVDGGTIAAGGRVRVQLRVTFDPQAPYGCYLINDYIPSGLRYIDSVSWRDNPENSRYSFSIDQEGQSVYGSLYRYREDPEDPEEPLADDVKVNPGTEPDDQNSDPNVYTATYYLSAAIPGEYVVESAYVTPQIQGAAAKSPRSTLTVGAAGEAKPKAAPQKPAASKPVEQGQASEAAAEQRNPDISGSPADTQPQEPKDGETGTEAPNPGTLGDPDEGTQEASQPVKANPGT